MQSFGDFLHQKRIERELTLRDFCKKTGLNSAYISRLERELESPPIEAEFYKIVKKHLNLSSSDMKLWKKLAKLYKKPPPPANIMEKMPAFLPPEVANDPQKLQKLIDLIKKEYE